MKKAILITSILLTAGLIVFLFFYPFTPRNAANIAFQVKYGQSVQKIADHLQNRGIISNADLFVLFSKITCTHNRLKAGQYYFAKKSSIYHVIDKMRRGKQAYIRLTIQEGLTSRKISQRVAAKLQADSCRFMQLVHDSTFAAQLGNAHSSLHGFLFTETYHFTLGVSEEQIIRTMVGLFRRTFPDSVVNPRAAELGYTFYEMLTLASIIQGEAVLDSEMVYISSVYHNRLQRNIPLQADPTIQYIIPDAPRRLLNRDLEIDSPYNTYRYAGLPPGPINNPGKAAIRAALNPAETAYLYFVADGSGGHVFTTNLKDHLSAKRRFDKIRRRVARQKRESAVGSKDE